MVRETFDSTFDQDIHCDACVVKLSAPWCGPCKALAPVFKNVSSRYPEIKAFELNVDNNQETPQKYGIRSVPTLLFFKNGELFNQLGFVSEEKLDNAFKVLL